MTVGSTRPIRKVILASGLHIEILQGDITRIPADAIVNAGNRQLRHGGGVAGAISRRGGAIIQQQSNAWVKKYGPIDVDHPAYTDGGDLPCQFVVHTAGPVWGEGDEANKLQRAITSALTLAEDLKAVSVSLPAISTGIFGFPVDQAAKIFMQAMRDFSQKTERRFLQTIMIVLYGRDALQAFTRACDDFEWLKKEP